MADKQEPKYKNYRVLTSQAKRIAKRTKRSRRSLTKELEVVIDAGLAKTEGRDE